MKKSRGGIYKIFNVETRKFYVGSAKNFVKRWSVHRSYLKKGQHHSQKLQNSWNKYGEDSFIFEIIEETLLEDLIKREQYYIDTLNPDYNIAPTAHSQLGFKHSKESKDKMRKARLGRPLSFNARAKITGENNPRYGIKLENWKVQKLKKERQGAGNPGSKLTEEQVCEIRLIFDTNSKVSQEDLASRYKVNRKTINNVVRRRTWKNI